MPKHPHCDRNSDIQENFPGLNHPSTSFTFNEARTNETNRKSRADSSMGVWLSPDILCSHLFALEDWNGAEQFRVKFIASTDNNEVIGSEQLINPSVEEILLLR